MIIIVTVITMVIKTVKLNNHHNCTFQLMMSEVHAI